MIINNVDVRQRSRGLVGVTDVGVVYTPSTMCSAQGGYDKLIYSDVLLTYDTPTNEWNVCRIV